VVGDSERNISFTIAPDETEVFDITAHTESCFCRWVLELVTTQDGEEEIVTVDDQGRPFETTAWGGAPRWEETPAHFPPYYTWNWSDERWTAMRDGDIVNEYEPEEGQLPTLSTAGEPPS
jgi:hypothetical protein